MGIKRRTGTTKSPPILSHEFVIANHADIVSCIAMIFVLCLLFQATAPIASLFVAIQHNITDGKYNTKKYRNLDSKIFLKNFLIFR
jgi:translocating chain-associated membrane protein 1